MDRIVTLGAAVLAGMAASPFLPAAPWLLVVGVAACIALPFCGLGGVRGWLVGFAVGACVAQTVPQGPVLAGPCAFLAVRTGPAMGRSGDVVVIRWLDGLVHPTGRVRVRFADAAPPPGARLIVLGDAGPVPRALPGAPDPVRGAAFAGVHTEVRARRLVPLSAPRTTPLPPERDPTGLLRALVLGDRRGLPPETVKLLRMTGTSHLISVSGFHVSIAAGLIVAWAAGLGRLAALLHPRGIALPAPAAGAAAAWFYVAVSGWSVPAQRAATLWTMAAATKVTGRRLSLMGALAWIAVGIAVIEPGTLATPSFGLSFGALAGILLWTPRLLAFVPPDLPRPVPFLATSTAVTLAATAGTLPLAAFWFQEVALTAPLANLFAGPLLGTAVVPLAGLSCLASGPVADALAHLATAICRFTLWGLAQVAFEPAHPAVGPVGAIALGLSVAVGARSLGVSGILFALVLTAPQAPVVVTQVTVLDVGQGDAVFIAYPDGRRWLVDGGPPSDRVLHWLRRHGVHHLDMIVLTHGDRDHWGGLVPVLEQLSVGALFGTDLPPEVRERCEAQGVAIRPALGAFHPWPGDPDQGNEGSTVFAVGPVLLTGDLDAAGELRLLPRLHSAPAAVLKVGHHGSATSTSDAFLDAVAPQVAILSVGAHNWYGHPHQDVLDRLEARNIRVYRTDRDGTVTITLNTPEPTVTSAVHPGNVPRTAARTP